MLSKIDTFIQNKVDFAFETTLSTKSYVNTIKRARKAGYQITLVFFWLDSVDLAIERVRTRVLEGGHNIPKPVIIRRYHTGLLYLFKLYIPICDYWMIFNNSKLRAKLIAEGHTDKEVDIKNISAFELIKSITTNDKKG